MQHGRGYRPTWPIPPGEPDAGAAAGDVTVLIVAHRPVRTGADAPRRGETRREGKDGRRRGVAAAAPAAARPLPAPPRRGRVDLGRPHGRPPDAAEGPGTRKGGRPLPWAGAARSG